MSPDIDTPARRPSDRLALVEHVHGTPDLQETDWLEWKSAYDLSKPAGRAATAKQILGFSNRMPDVAARNAGGHAHLLLGVEPGTYEGMPVHDSADVENWLRPYLGDKVLYDIHYVTVDGRSILVITVDPPQWGDDIHTLRKESVDEDTGKTIPRGSIFVRKSGKTERASDTDVDRLTERARRQGATLSLSVEAEAPLGALPADCFEDGFRNGYLAERKAALMSNVPDEADPYTGFARPAGEFRSHQEFAYEVRRFGAAARRDWSSLALVKAVEARKPMLRLALVNPTDDNFEGVQIEVTLPLSHTLVFHNVGEARARIQPPEEPAPWGKQHMAMLEDIRFDDFVPGGPSVEPAGSDATLIRFEPVHARPRTRHALPGVVVAALPRLAGEVLNAAWRATSTSTRGEITGTVDVTIEADED